MANLTNKEIVELIADSTWANITVHEVCEALCRRFLSLENDYNLTKKRLEDRIAQLERAYVRQEMNTTEETYMEAP